MALHADTRELGPATHQRASDTLGGFGGGANGHEPEYGATSGNEPLERRTNAATLPITNAELGWDAIRDIKQMPKTDAIQETRITQRWRQGSNRTLADTLKTLIVTLQGQ
jgi:hypothetical protein